MTTKRATIILIVFRVLLIAAALWTLNSIIGVAKASTGGDCDGDGRITMGDPVWLINYIFGGGPEPKPCECPKSFFLFDNQIPQAVETYYVDQDWEEAYIGGRTFVKGGPVRRVYSIGPDSQPSWFLMVPDTVVWEIADTIGSSMMSYSVAPIPVDTEPVWTNGAVYSQPDLKAMMAKYGGTYTIPVDVDSVDFSASKMVAWYGLYTEPEWSTLEGLQRKWTFYRWRQDWEAGLITYRQYLDLRLKYKVKD